MRNVFLHILITIPLTTFAKEDCSEEGLGFSTTEDIEVKYFYTGTCHYRNKDYQESARYWEKLANLKTVKEQNRELKISVLNNLAYLKFFGMGLNQEKYRAIEYWTEAISLGHVEAEYHLCHAYGDYNQPTYNRAKAISHCNKAFLLYSDKEILDDEDKQILKIIKEYRSKLNA